MTHFQQKKESIACTVLLYAMLAMCKMQRCSLIKRKVSRSKSKGDLEIKMSRSYTTMNIGKILEIIDSFY